MRMEKLKRAVALALCALTLSLSITTAYTMPVYASNNEVIIALEKLLDMSLTKTGISANNSLLSKLQAHILNMLNGTASSYEAYCSANGYDYSTYENWDAYLNSDAFYLQDLPFAESWMKFLQSVYFFDWLLGSAFKFDLRTEIMESDYVQYLAKTSVAVQGEKYVIEDEDVEAIRDSFDYIVEDEAGYYYIDTWGPCNLNPSWFKTKSEYDSFIDLIKSYEGVMYGYGASSFKYVFSTGSDNKNTFSNNLVLYIPDEEFALISSTKTNYYCSYGVYNSNWESGMDFRGCDLYLLDNIPTSYADYIENESLNTVNYKALNNYVDGAQASNFQMILTCDGRQVRVFKTLNDYKLFDSGVQPYYMNVTYDYSTTNDNSMTFDGDYYRNNGDVISYETVTENIDNSQDNSYTNIDNSINNIINNYYGSSGSDDSGNSSGSGDDSSSDVGFGDLLTGIADLLDFVLGLLGKIISLISTFLDSALSLLSGLGSQFGGFSELLGEMFTFLPEEFLDALTAGLTLMIGVAIYKAAKS